jgi:hypothetical protein
MSRCWRRRRHAPGAISRPAARGLAAALLAPKRCIRRERAEVGERKAASVAWTSSSSAHGIGGGPCADCGGSARPTTPAPGWIRARSAQRSLPAALDLTSARAPARAAPAAAPRGPASRSGSAPDPSPKPAPGRRNRPARRGRGPCSAELARSTWAIRRRRGRPGRGRLRRAAWVSASPPLLASNGILRSCPRQHDEARPACPGRLRALAQRLRALDTLAVSLRTTSPLRARLRAGLRAQHCREARARLGPRLRLRRQRLGETPSQPRTTRPPASAAQDRLPVGSDRKPMPSEPPARGWIAGDADAKQIGSTSGPPLFPG